MLKFLPWWVLYPVGLGKATTYMLQSGLEGYSVFAFFYMFAEMNRVWKAAQMNLSIGVNVELTDVLEAYDGESFQWYFSIVESFNDIFLKIQSFNGTEPISPFE